MSKTIENLTRKIVDNFVSDDNNIYIGNDLFIAMNARKFGLRLLRTGQPYRVDNGRVIRVISGHARSIANMVSHDFEAGKLVVIPAGSIFEIEEVDEDFNIQTFSFSELPQETAFKECAVFHLNDDDWQLTGKYLDLLWSTVKRNPLSLSVVRALQTALLMELHVIYNKETVEHKQRPVSRQEDILHRFTTLVNEHAACEHSIAFYADRLCLTPNYLGAVIREASGQTVMQWIHRYIIQQAKLQLKYSDQPIWQIAESLNFPNPSFFSKFFKRETGMTPAEYRNR
ncbi:MAG: helix-turn-helix domain-containing protein [Prevotella sp.]|nr:helix-turn-helix domain-containing protein [Prevotella sp.]